MSNEPGLNVSNATDDKPKESFMKRLITAAVALLVLAPTVAQAGIHGGGFIGVGIGGGFGGGRIDFGRRGGFGLDLAFPIYAPIYDAPVVYSEPAPVYIYSQPAPPIVYYTQPAPAVVYTQPAPPVVYSQPQMIQAPAPIVVQPGAPTSYYYYTAPPQTTYYYSH